MKTLLIVLLLATGTVPAVPTPCLADENDFLTNAYEEVYQQSQRIRERQADYFLQKNEIERQQAEFERNYEGDNDTDHYHDQDMEDHDDWDDYGYDD